MSDEYARRRKRLRGLMDREGLDGLLVSHLPDVRYICGFTGSSGTVLLLRRGGYFLTDFRYREQSAGEVEGLRTAVYERSLEDELGDILGRRDGLLLGFDPHSLPYARVLSLRRSLRDEARLKPIKSSLALLRARKSRQEVETIRKAVYLAESSFKRVLGELEGGMSERDFALRLDTAARREGAEDRAFETIVASGERSSLVHAEPSRRRMGGVTIVDWGSRYDGYHSDISRTLAFGRIPSELRRVHRVVLEAQRRALDKIRPGIKAGEVDRAARDLIQEEGYGEYFGHGLGHGVGLEVHERPHVSRGSRDVLEKGMVFTVEPGVYLPGTGGVRVEDMVLVTEAGAELLTTLPRGLEPGAYRGGEL